MSNNGTLPGPYGGGAGYSSGGAKYNSNGTSAGGGFTTGQPNDAPGSAAWADADSDPSAADGTATDESLAQGGYTPSGGIAGNYLGPSIGQQTGGAESLANALSAYGQAAQTRQAAQIQAPTGADPRAQQQQQQGLAQLQAAANGKTPSAAGIGQSAAIQGGAGAAYAAMRGGGGFGGANASAARGAHGSAAVTQGGAGRAQEIGSAQQALSGGVNAMTGQAVQQQQQDQNVALAQAQLQQQQLQSNNQAQLGYQGMATQTQLAQLNADSDFQLAQSGDASQLAVQNIQQNAAASNQIQSGAYSAAGSGMGALANYASHSNSSGGQSQSGGGMNNSTGEEDDDPENW